MSKLRLGPIPRPDIVRVTVAIPAPLKENLDRYAELYAATYGEQADAVALIPHMLASFMAGDRGFKKARQSSAPAGEISPRSTDAAISSASDTASDESSSR